MAAVHLATALSVLKGSSVFLPSMCCMLIDSQVNTRNVNESLQTLMNRAKANFPTAVPYVFQDP